MQAQLILRRTTRDSLSLSVVKSAEEILSTVRRLEHLITNFTDVTRQQRLDLRLIRPRAFLEAVVDFWRPLATKRGVDVACEVSEDLPAVRADPEKLRRVLDSLVKNALEAIDHGPGRVSLRASMIEPERIRLSVEDTGSGMPEDIQAFALFETTKPDGSGIGLSIAQELVLAHDGRISFERRTPAGTTFHVDLPCRD
jgi:signal transduction histidine kinase